MSDQAIADIASTIVQPAPVADPAPVSQPAPEPVVDDGAELGAAWDRAMKQERGTDGRFVAATPADEPAPATDPAAPVVDPKAQQQPVSTTAPAHMPQSIKAEWDKMPETARAAIAAHQADMDRKFGEIGKQFQAVKPIADKLTHAVSSFPDFAGMTPDQLAQGAIELAAVQVNLHKNPVGTIIEIANHYGVLPKLAAAMQGQTADPNAGNDQLIRGLQQKIANLEASLSKASNPDSIRETVSQTINERETGNMVTTFAQNEGKEYWTDVEASMPEFIRIVQGSGAASSPKEVLAQAYDMAINANPAVRAKVRAAEAKATVTQLDPQRAANAKKAASINVKSSSAGSERAPTEEEAMGAAWDRAMAN